MTKEQWIIDRDKTELSEDVWFDYYKDTGGRSDNRDSFKVAFALVISGNRMHLKEEGMFQINFNTAIKRINKYYNNKFEL